MEPVYQWHSHYIINYILPNQPWFGLEIIPVAAVPGCFWQTCGYEGQQRMRQSWRVRWARWALILILTLTMAIPVTWGIFHRFFPHLQSDHRSEISSPNPPLELASSATKTQHMQRKICWQCLQQLLFSEVGYWSVSLPCCAQIKSSHIFLAKV